MIVSDLCRAKNMIQIHEVTTAKDAPIRALRLLEATLDSFMGLPILLLVSGGSALNMFAKPSGKTDFSTITVGVLDERFTLDTSAHNFKKFSETPYYLGAKHHGAVGLDMDVKKGEALSLYGKRVDKHIRDWISMNKRGKVVIVQGIGPDGHTAGVMPNPNNPKEFASLFISTQRCFVGYESHYAHNPYSQRATVTLYFLQQYVHVSLVYVLGEDKRKALKLALSTKDLATTPAGVISHMSKVHIVTDIHGVTHKILPT